MVLYSCLLAELFAHLWLPLLKNLFIFLFFIHALKQVEGGEGGGKDTKERGALQHWCNFLFCRSHSEVGTVCLSEFVDHPFYLSF